MASDGSNSNFSFTEGNTPTYNKSVATLQSEGWITSDSVLASEYDAAQAHWGGDWRMPTDQELNDLINNCDWEWTTMNGINGYIVHGKGGYSSASIFIPCAGFGKGASFDSLGTYGTYWSSILDLDNYGSWHCYVRSSSSGGTGYGPRYYGRPVRPVQGEINFKCGTVSFNVGGGSSVNPISVRVGQPIGELPTPTRDEYTFLGWFTAAEGGVAVTPKTVVTANMTIYARWKITHEKVQLWEGGPYWATTNIGAEKPEDYGYYFWWGDTVGYKREDDKWVASDGSNLNFSFTASNTPTYNKEISALQSEGWITADGVLSQAHDAAHNHWGDDWRIPTQQELDALSNKCDWTWSTINGVNGYIVCGRGDYSSNSIFLPISGYGGGTSLHNSNVNGRYWSSVPHSDDGGSRILAFDLVGYSTSDSGRFYGRPVRPIQGVSCVAVTFDACGGSSVDSISIPLGQAIGELPVPTRNGYTFVGWFTAANGGTQMTANTTVSVSMTTLYAQWQKTHEKVQLWEGGPYWATTNIGAEKPEDYGYYFWWGDTVGYKRENNKWVASDGSNSNFSFSSGNTPTYGKYNSTLQSEGWITADGVLSPEHDAAQKHWGGDWRMPTEQEFDDLNSKCDWTWGSMNGVNGYVVRGRGDYSSASIFLPCAGYGSRTSLNLAGAGGFYWSSVPRSDYGSAWGLGIDSGIHGTDGSSRLNGQSVRPLQGFTK